MTHDYVIGTWLPHDSLLLIKTTQIENSKIKSTNLLLRKSETQITISSNYVFKIKICYLKYYKTKSSKGQIETYVDFNLIIPYEIRVPYYC